MFDKLSVSRNDGVRLKEYVIWQHSAVNSYYVDGDFHYFI